MSKQQLSGLRETEYNDFDYNHADPETMKEWEAEFRRQNWRDMHSYLKRFPYVTPEEKKALRSWVRSGHSPYENGDFIATESGGPMDFINALRFWEDVCHEYSGEENDCRKQSDETILIPVTPAESGSDVLPF